MKQRYSGVDIIPFTGNKEIAVKLAKALAKTMRTEDKKECMAAGYSPFKSALESLLLSDEAYVAEAEEGPVMLFGITGDGLIWALGSSFIEKHKKALVACGMDYIKECLNRHSFLYNYISEDNIKALRFIRRAGAETGAGISIGNTRFLKFVIRREKDVQCNDGACGSSRVCPTPADSAGDKGANDDVPTAGGGGCAKCKSGRPAEGTGGRQVCTGADEA